MVPRLRIWKWPMSGIASASSGTASPAAVSCSTVLWRVIDFTVSVPLVRSTPRSSSTRLRSMMWSKRVSRKREHRHQALPTGEHLGLVAVLGEQRGDVAERLGRVVLERCGLHRQLPAWMGRVNLPQGPEPRTSENGGR